MEPFPWTCPYCDRDTIITPGGSQFVSGDFVSPQGGNLLFSGTMITCPNKSCRQYTLTCALTKGIGASDSRGNVLLRQMSGERWQLKPNSSAKPMPEYVPGSIKDDYNEACVIRDLSPKASATLSRRCLQGMIRDFHGVRKGTLALEILAIKDEVDSATWAAIDAVRQIGNIGAHMERDINVIVEVDPQEAQLLIGLIEALIKEWYVAKHDREERMTKLVALAETKRPRHSVNSG